MFICLFILGSWHRSYYIMRSILFIQKERRNLKKKKKEGNKMGKETDRQTDILPKSWICLHPCLLSKPWFHFRWSVYHHRTKSQLQKSPILFTINIKKKNEFRQSWRLWIISFCHVNCTAINISVFNKRHIKKLFWKNLKMCLSQPSIHIDYSQWIILKLKLLLYSHWHTLQKHDAYSHVHLQISFSVMHLCIFF